MEACLDFQLGPLALPLKRAAARLRCTGKKVSFRGAGWRENDFVVTKIGDNR